MSTKNTQAASTPSGKLSLRREVVRELEVRTGVKTGVAKCQYSGGICEKTCCSPVHQPTQSPSLI